MEGELGEEGWHAGGLATSAKQKISFDMISFLVFVPRKIAMTSTSALDSTPAGAAARLKRKRGGVAAPSVNITAAAAGTQHASGSWVGSCPGLFVGLLGLLGGCCGLAGLCCWWA